MLKSSLYYCFFFFLIISSFLLFCKKKENKLIISGKAVNEQTGQTVSGMNVSLSAKIISNGTWNSQYSLIESQTTGNDGSFIINFDNLRASEFKLSFSQNGYFEDDYFIRPDLLIVGEDYNNTYYVHYEAWIKLIIKNYPPYSSEDVVSYRFLKGKALCPNGCSDSLFYLSGTNIDTYHLCKLYGSQNAVIEWIFSNLNTNQQHIDTVWIQPGDTTLYNIIF